MKPISLRTIVGLALVCGLLAVCLLAAAAPQPDGDDGETYEPDLPPSHSGELVSPRKRFELPKMFDFDRYREVFKKTYRSAIEIVVRQKIFLAAAFRAMISAIKYKYNLMPYYLKVNDRSDYTKAEEEASQNKVMGKSLRPDVFPDEEQMMDLETIRKELQMVEQRADEAGFREIAKELHVASDGPRRKRRETARTRDISLDDVAGSPDDGPEAPEVLAKVRNVVPSNNPLHVQPDTISYGSEEEEPIEIVDEEYFYNAARAPSSDADEERGNWLSTLASQLVKTAGGLVNKASKGSPSQGNLSPATPAPQNLPDEVFIDHRSTGCMFKPRSQGKCGSCYAFAFIAMIEYLNCMETGDLVPFSEQYLVDCGWREKLDGCEGAYVGYTGLFLIKYGLELRTNYPYRERTDECPYSKDTKPERMGYMKSKMRSVLKVPQSSFEEILKKQPIVINVSTKGDFKDYGGGVHTGSGCADENYHAVLLIGHGREDNEEYWLIRNSHSTAYGEGGYYKLNKKSTKCLLGPGFVFGNKSSELGWKPLVNLNHDVKPVKRHYMNNLKKEMASKLSPIAEETDSDDELPEAAELRTA